MRTIAAAKFKATCLAVMDEVQTKRESVMITKNGRPVAKLVPLAPKDASLAEFLFPGRIEILGDIMSPIHTEEELEEMFEESMKVFG